MITKLNCRLCLKNGKAKTSKTTSILVNQAVAEMGWKAEPSVDLGLFSFQKLVIYKDLEANAYLVTQHPIIRAIAGIKEDNLILDGLPDEKDVDKIELPEKTYQVLMPTAANESQLNMLCEDKASS